MQSQATYLQSPRATVTDDNSNNLVRHNSPSKYSADASVELLEETFDTFVSKNKNWKKWVTSQQF